MCSNRHVKILSGLLLVLFVTIGLAAKVLQARNFFNPAVMAGQGMVGLPYMLQDNTGNNWRLYQGGWFQQNNNMPLYSQGAMLTVDGQNPNAGANAARKPASQRLHRHPACVAR
jgi:hypothetical protein